MSSAWQASLLAPLWSTGFIIFFILGSLVLDNYINNAYKGRLETNLLGFWPHKCKHSNTSISTSDTPLRHGVIFSPSCVAFLIFLIHLATLGFSANHGVTANFTASNCDQIRAFSSGSENNVFCSLMNSWQQSHLPFCFASPCSSNSRQPLLNYTILHSGFSKAKKKKPLVFSWSADFLIIEKVWGQKGCKVIIAKKLWVWERGEKTKYSIKINLLWLWNKCISHYFSLFTMLIF